MVARTGPSIDGAAEISSDETYTNGFSPQTGVDRRAFLGGTGLAAAGVLVESSVPFVLDLPGGFVTSVQAQPATPPVPPPLNYPGKTDKLVVLGERPLVAETPEHLLDDDTTPIDKFFVRNNGPIPEAAKDPDFAAANPEMIPGGLCLYVGLTGLSPERRFRNHRRGHKSARIVRRHGRRLLPAYYRQYNPVPFEVGRVLEPWLAARLRERRFGVWQN